MKLGIVGAGMIVNGLFQFIHSVAGVELSAICATPKSVDKLKKMCEEQHIPNWYTDIDELLKDENVDTVYVALPNHMHFEVGMKALEAGKDVIMEKPFTSTYEEACALKDKAMKAGKYVLEAVTTNFLPNVIHIKDMLPELGDIKIVSLNYSQYSSRYDAFLQGDILPAFDPKKSGGALMDLNIYNINFVTFLFGEPKSVSYHPNIERGIDTSGILYLDYGSFQCVCIAAKDCKAPMMNTIQGTKGNIVFHSPANVVEDYHFQLNKDHSHKLAEEGDLFNYNEQTRMYYEFVEFEKILSSRDSSSANEILNHSLLTMKIQTDARTNAGIYFPADKKG